jgi:hypothetical protein
LAERNPTPLHPHEPDHGVESLIKQDEGHGGKVKGERRKAEDRSGAGAILVRLLYARLIGPSATKSVPG